MGGLRPEVVNRGNASRQGILDNSNAILNRDYQMTDVQYTCLILAIFGNTSLLIWIIGSWAKKILAAVARR